jgi:DNA repair protein RadC
MPFRAADNFVSDIFRSANRRDDRQGGVRDSGRFSFIFSDSFSLVRTPGTSEEECQVRRLSVLANLIRPIAGNRSAAIAAQLIDRFGGLAGALQASPHSLADALPDDAEFSEQFVAARDIMREGLREQVTGSPVNPADPRLREYLRCLIGLSREERVAAIFVGSGDHYLAEEVIEGGSTTTIGICQRQLFRRALDIGAMGLLLAHNHPSGNCRPSAHDLRATQSIESIGLALGVRLMDHLIVTPSRIYSMRERA